MPESRAALGALRRVRRPKPNHGDCQGKPTTGEHDHHPTGAAMNADGARRGAKPPDVAMNPAEVTQLLAAGYSISLTTIGADGDVVCPRRRPDRLYDPPRLPKAPQPAARPPRRRTRRTRPPLRAAARRPIPRPGTRNDRRTARVELAAPLDRKYSQHPPPELAHTIRRRAVYTVTVLATSSWDHRKLGAVVVVTAHRNPYRRGHHGVDGEREPTTARAITVGWPVRRSVLRCGGPRTATPCVVG